MAIWWWEQHITLPKARRYLTAMVSKTAGVKLIIVLAILMPSNLFIPSTMDFILVLTNCWYMLMSLLSSSICSVRDNILMLYLKWNQMSLFLCVNSNNRLGFFHLLNLLLYLFDPGQVLMLVAWVVKIVKSCCTNSTFSLVSARPARGKLLFHDLMHSTFSVFFPELWQWLRNSIEGPKYEIKIPLVEN